MNPEQPGLIACTLADELAAGGWDDPPRLYTIRLQAGRCDLLPVALPVRAWTRGHPPDVLRSLAAAAAQAVREPGYRAPAGLYGAAFRFEGWDLPWDRMSREQFRQGMIDASAGRIHARPDRIEVRILHGLDMAGITYVARQQRGQPQVHAEICRAGQDRGYAGVIPDTLSLVVTALAGTRSSRHPPGAQPGR
jgi:hypothetical protein